MARIKIERSDGASSKHELGFGQTRIGSDRSCEIRVADPGVDPVHAIIRFGPVIDQGGRTGLFVNGYRIDGEHVFGEGDSVTLGPDGVRITFEDTAAPVAGGRADLRSLEAELAQARNAAAERAQRIGELEQELRTMKSRVSERDERLELVARDHASDVEDLRRSHAVEVRDVREKAQELDRMRTQEIEKYKSRVRQLEEQSKIELGEFAERTVALQRETADKNEELLATQRAVDELQARVAEWEQSLSEADTVPSLKRKLGELEFAKNEQVAALRSAMDKLQAHHEAERQKLLARGEGADSSGTENEARDTAGFVATVLVDVVGELEKRVMRILSGLGHGSIGPPAIETNWVTLMGTDSTENRDCFRRSVEQFHGTLGRSAELMFNRVFLKWVDDCFVGRMAPTNIRKTVGPSLFSFGGTEKQLWEKYEEIFEEKMAPVVLEEEFSQSYQTVRSELGL